MRTKRALIWLLVATALQSSILAYLDFNEIAEPKWMTLGTAVLSSFLIFMWYRDDSGARSYSRSQLLNVAVVVVPFIAVPYYLIRSRSQGERLQAIGKLIGFFALFAVAMLVGVLAVALGYAAIRLLP